MLLNIQQAFVVLLILVVKIQCQTIQPEDSSNFIGYYIAHDSTEALTASNLWITSGSYAGDCNTPRLCPFATQCVNNRLTWNNGAVVPCTGIESCVTISIYTTSPPPSSSVLNFKCRLDWRAFTIYRALPATTTPALSIITSMPPSPSFVSTPAPAPTPAPTLVLPPAPPTTIPATPKQKSKVWIAGAVIGPVAGIALIAAAMYWWRRRSGKAREEFDMDSQGRGHSEMYAPVQQYHNKDSDGQCVELPVAQPPVELAANNLR